MSNNLSFHVSRNRYGRPCSAASLVVAALVIGVRVANASITSEPPHLDFEVLDLVVDRQLFGEICQLLVLGEKEREMVEPSFEEYLAKAAEVDAASYQRVLDAGWREILELEEREEEDWDRAQELYRSYKKESVLGKRAGDALLEEWLTALASSLELDSGQMGTVRRLIRRVHYFRQFGGNRHHDFSHPINLLDLVQRASRPGGELAGPVGSATTEKPRDDDIHDRGAKDAEHSPPQEAIQEILQHYELRLDDYLAPHFAKKRRVPPPSKKVVITSDDPEWKLHEKRVARSWSERHDLFASAADQISEVLGQTSGLEMKERWQDRVDRELCPELTAERWPDAMVKWLEMRNDHTEAQLDAARLLLAEYQVKRNNLVRAARDLGIRCMRRYGRVRGTESAVLRYAKKQLEVYRLSVRTIRRLESHLEPPQIAALRNEIKRRIPYSLGPPIATSALVELEALDEYFAGLKDR